MITLCWRYKKGLSNEVIFLKRVESTRKMICTLGKVKSDLYLNLNQKDPMDLTKIIVLMLKDLFKER